MSTERNDLVAASAPTVLSPEMVALLEQLQANSNATLIAAIAELRKPDEVTAAKQLLEAERDRMNVLRKVDDAKRQEAGRARAQLSCSHTLPNGKTRLRGQRNSNNTIQAFCSSCHFLSKPFPATDHERDGGVNMSEWGAMALAMVNRRIAAAEQSGFVPGPVPEVPFGATIQF